LKAQLSGCFDDNLERNTSAEQQVCSCFTLLRFAASCLVAAG
jgi:hypothetical protein